LHITYYYLYTTWLSVFLITLQINIDIKPLASPGLPVPSAGNVFRTTMAHDTGSSVLTLFQDEVELMYSTTLANLNLVNGSLKIASGSLPCRFLFVSMRILKSDHRAIVVDWKPAHVSVMPRTPMDVRLSPQNLERDLYTCMSPKTMNLHVGCNKSQMVSEVPAGQEL
jgi:hypothetical protein